MARDVFCLIYHQRMGTWHGQRIQGQCPEPARFDGVFANGLRHRNDIQRRKRRNRRHASGRRGNSGPVIDFNYPSNKQNGLIKPDRLHPSERLANLPAIRVFSPVDPLRKQTSYQPVFVSNRPLVAEQVYPQEEEKQEHSAQPPLSEEVRQAALQVVAHLVAEPSVALRQGLAAALLPRAAPTAETDQQQTSPYPPAQAAVNHHLQSA